MAAKPKELLAVQATGVETGRSLGSGSHMSSVSQTSGLPTNTQENNVIIQPDVNRDATGNQGNPAQPLHQFQGMLPSYSSDDTNLDPISAQDLSTLQEPDSSLDINVHFTQYDEAVAPLDAILKELDALDSETKKTPPVPKPRRNLPVKGSPGLSETAGLNLAGPSAHGSTQPTVNVTPATPQAIVTQTEPYIARAAADEPQPLNNLPSYSGGAKPKTTPMRTSNSNRSSSNNTNYSQKSTAQIRPNVDPQQQRTIKNVAKPMRTNDNPVTPTLKLRPENNKPSGYSSLPVNNNDNKTAQDHAMSEQEALGKFKLHVQRAKLKEQRDQTNEAIKEFKEALRYEKIARGEVHEEVARTCGLVGRMCSKQGRSKEAVQYLEEELSIYNKLELKLDYFAEKFWMTYDSLAQAYSGMNAKDKEIECYEKAIQIIMDNVTVPPARLPHMHNNVGNAYRTSRDLNKAREHIERAKEMMEMMHGDDPIEEMAKVHSSLGDVYRDLHLIPEAIRELERCLAIREKIQTGPEGHVLRGPTHDALASLYEEFGNNEKAKEHRDAKQQGMDSLLHADPEQKQQMVKNLKGMVKGAGTGMLGTLTAGLTAHEDINKAQQYQAEENSMKAIEHYNKAIASLENMPPGVAVTEEILNTQALCHNNIGNAYRKIARVSEAEEHLKKALELRRQLFADEANDETASTLFNLGHLLQGIGGRVNTTNAIEYHEQCLDIYLKIGLEVNHKWIISLYRSLGQAYEAIGNSRKSIQNYEKAKALLINTEDMDGLRAVCNNMGNSYETIGDYQKAEENIEQALNMSVVLAFDNPDDLTIQNHIAAGYNNLGILYQGQGRYKDSLDNLLKSLDIREKYREFNAEAAQDASSSYHNIGNTYAKMDQFPKAIEYYEKELECRRLMGEDTTNVRVTMSHVYQQIGEAAKAEQILEEC